MGHELKVILGATAMQTKVFIDDQPVGLIQEIKFVANASTGNADIELTFPDLQQCRESNSGLVKGLEYTLDLLKEFPHIRVIQKPLW